MKHAAVYILVLTLMLVASSNAPDLIFEHFYPAPGQTEETTALIVELEPVVATPISRSAPEESLETWTITAYCACEICCPGSSDGLTANMSTPLEGVTIAADQSIPFGTRIWIEGLGERTVMDRGGAITGNHIDVYFEDHAAAKAFGIKELAVRIVE